MHCTHSTLTELPTHELSLSGKSGEVYDQHAVGRVSEPMHNMQSHSDASSGEEK
jgi:hypothetical protein